MEDGDLANRYHSMANGVDEIVSQVGRSLACIAWSYVVLQLEKIVGICIERFYLRGTNQE